MIKLRLKSAFTLIETLLYLVIAATMMLAITAFLVLVVQARVKFQTVSEVEQQGQFAMSAITQALRQTQTVNSPAAGSSDVELNLTIPSAVDNPVIFNINGGSLTETVGSSGGYSLTAPNVDVSNLSFVNLASPGAPASVRVQFTLSYDNSAGGGEEYNYSADFYDTVTLRQ